MVDFKIIVGIVLVVVVGFIFFRISKGGLEKAFGFVIEPIKKMLGIDSKEAIEKQKEAERVGKELLEISGNVHESFAALIGQCININQDDRLCLCGTMDFTKLNAYYLKISSDGTTQSLELLDSKLVPVAGKTKSLGSFSIGPIDVTSKITNSGTASDYLKPGVIANRIKDYNSKQIIFSKDETVFNTNKKSQVKMNSINLIKATKDTIAIDEENNVKRKCGERLNCAKNYVVYNEVTSKIEQGQSGLPTNSFEVCSNLEPNYCYRHNDQYIHQSRCEAVTITNAVVCSKNFQADSPIKESLSGGMEKTKINGVEAFTKFKYVYEFKDVFGKNDAVNNLISELKSKNINVEVIMLDTVKPFESDKSNDVSLVAKQIFNKFYGKNYILIVIAADGKIEMILGDNAKNKLKANDEICQRFLDKFLQINTDNLQSILEDIKKRTAET